MSVTFPPRLKRVRKAAEKAGWTAALSGKGHPRLLPPRGLRHALDAQGNIINGKVAFEGEGPLVAPLTFSLTPSDVAADRNGISALRRAGVAL